MSLVCFQTIARACMARESTRTLTAENFYEYVMRVIRNLLKFYSWDISSLDNTNDTNFSQRTAKKYLFYTRKC